MSEQLTFELTDESQVNSSGCTVYRIRATRDIVRWGVARGDLGGWVSTAELENGEARITGDAWVFDNAQIFDNAQVGRDARVSDDAWVSGNARVYGMARVYGSAWIYSDAWVGDGTQVYGNAHVYGNAQLSDDARVYGGAQVHGNAWVYGNAQVYGGAQVHGNVSLSGNAWISGEADISEIWHFITVGPLGSEGATATVFRTKNGDHSLNLHCWNGKLETLMAEVERRRDEEDCWRRADPATQAVWLDQYRLLKQIGETTVSRWAAETTRQVA